MMTGAVDQHRPMELTHLLTTGTLYEDPGADYFERRHDPAIEAKRLSRRIEALGFAVTLTDKAA